MASDKPLVLVIGANGRTGASIVDGLLASGNFRVAASVRPQSLLKPTTEKIRTSGVEIRAGDITDSMDKLEALLDGVDVLISAVVGYLVDAQKDIILAAKKLGVKRVIPCDWATPGEKGVRQRHDMKLAMRDFIRELGVPHTFIDVGWWMQLYLPIATRSPAPQTDKDNSWLILKDRNPRMLLTHLDHIGTYVARIISDPRTLNQAVIVWEDEVTQNEAHEIGERASGEEEELKARRIYVSSEVFKLKAAEGMELAKTNPKALPIVTVNEYLHSLFVLEENTLQNAKRLGYLDARELYPDIEPATLKDYAKDFYETDGGWYYVRD